MITGTISISDYLDAQRLHRARAERWYYLASGTTFAIGIVLYFFTSRNIGLVVACAGVGGLVGELIMSRGYLPWKVSRLYRQQKDLATPFTYAWDFEYLEAKGISGQSKREWVNYAKFKEDEKMFLLYHSDYLFEMLPKSWFRDQEQIAEFRRLANRAGQT